VRADEDCPCRALRQGKGSCLLGKTDKPRAHECLANVSQLERLKRFGVRDGRLLLALRVVLAHRADFL
jgi:hypothetical protein